MELNTVYQALIHQLNEKLPRAEALLPNQEEGQGQTLVAILALRLNA